MIREVLQLGNPQLRQIAQPVAINNGDGIFLTVAELQNLSQDLLDTMQEEGGIGIAAPQIGVSLRVMVVASQPNVRYPQAPAMAPLVTLNPVLEWASDVTVKDWEGCLSVPGIRAQVPRSIHIRVSYTDASTLQETHIEYRDFVARVWLHEFDHLNGIVYPDRMESTRDMVTEAEYRKLMLASTKPE
jgi:peptide deformylase